MKFLCGCGDGTFMSSIDPNTGSLSSFSAPVRSRTQLSWIVFGFLFATCHCSLQATLATGRDKQ